MFIMTARLSKPKLIVCALAVLAVILVVVLIVCGGKEAPSTLPAGGTNEERLAFLAAHGRSVSAAPTETQTVSIPEINGNDVMERYNALQKSQGFDLTSYVGKDVQRYVYEVLNAPDAKGKVYATLLVYDCRIIGGDVTDAGPDGLICGFDTGSCVPGSEATEPSESAPATESAAPTAEPGTSAEPTTESSAADQ